MGKQIESERIININDLESLISEARTNTLWVQKSLERGDKETSISLLKQLDLCLHKMEAFEFRIERRTITKN